jgi:hypothetical protein
MNRISDYGGPMATLRKWVIGASVFLCYASMIFSPTGCGGRRLQPEDWPEEESREPPPSSPEPRQTQPAAVDKPLVCLAIG